jgi:hypothetical protein
MKLKDYGESSLVDESHGKLSSSPGFKPLYSLAHAVVCERR